MTLSKNKVFALLVAFFAAFVLCSCSGNNQSDDAQEYDPLNDESATAIQASVTKDENSNSAILAAQNVDFANAGFELGDSCDVEFENGYKLTDVPFYDGEYVSDGESLILSGDNSADIVIKNKNADLWTAAGLFDGCKAKITLNTKEKYKDTQQKQGKSGLDISPSEDEDSSQAGDSSQSDDSSQSEDEDHPKSAGGPEDE